MLAEHAGEVDPYARRDQERFIEGQRAVAAVIAPVDGAAQGDSAGSGRERHVPRRHDRPAAQAAFEVNGTGYDAAPGRLGGRRELGPKRRERLLEGDILDRSIDHEAAQLRQVRRAVEPPAEQFCGNRAQLHALRVEQHITCRPNVGDSHAVDQHT